MARGFNSWCLSLHWILQPRQEMFFTVEATPWKTAGLSVAEETVCSSRGPTSRRRLKASCNSTSRGSCASDLSTHRALPHHESIIPAITGTWQPLSPITERFPRALWETEPACLFASLQGETVYVLAPSRTETCSGSFLFYLKVFCWENSGNLWICSASGSRHSPLSTPAQFPK